jgi:hypothetical protein
MTAVLNAVVVEMTLKDATEDEIEFHDDAHFFYWARLILAAGPRLQSSLFVKTCAVLFHEEL